MAISAESILIQIFKALFGEMLIVSKEFFPSCLAA
jgi:hypothetical protein